MKCSVFIATSLDGFIAREDGGLDWLPDVGSDPEGNDYGYKAFISDVDYIVMGRNTYDVVHAFEKWPYGNTKVIVLSTSMKTVPPEHNSFVEIMCGSPAKIVEVLKERGARHLYVDGGKTIHGFLEGGLITDVIITRIPVLIGKGIPLFGPRVADIRLQLHNTHAFANGLLQSIYTVQQ